MRQRLTASGRKEPLKKAQARSKAALKKARALKKRTGEKAAAFKKRKALAITRAKLY